MTQLSPFWPPASKQVAEVDARIRAEMQKRGRSKKMAPICGYLVSKPKYGPLWIEGSSSWGLDQILQILGVFLNA